MLKILDPVTSVLKISIVPISGKFLLSQTMNQHSFTTSHPHSEYHPLKGNDSAELSQFWCVTGRSSRQVTCEDTVMTTTEWKEHNSGNKKEREMWETEWLLARMNQTEWERSNLTEQKFPVDLREGRANVFVFFLLLTFLAFRGL